MCRLFAQISASPATAERFLVGSPCSLLKQSDAAKDNLQKDGWGVAWWNRGRAKVSKSPRPVFKEAHALTRLALKARSPVVMAHIRAASNPRGVARRLLINEANTQPFTDGTWAFAHNGTLEIPEEIQARLGPLARRVKALNDSEVYFWQFIKFLRALGDPAAAFEACVREIWSSWSLCKRRYPGKKSPYTSLNALASDGRRLYALCHSARPGAARFGACNPSQPWQTMSFSRRGASLVVGSENLDGGRWTRFNPPELLCAEISAGSIKVNRRRFEVAS